MTEAEQQARRVTAAQAPFPWFGGKRRIARLVWERFGDVPNYVEPFAGSLAVLLGRPTPPKVETVNDRDAYLANFWRALQHEPGAVAEWADWPVNETDLHARHRWLVAQDGFRERMLADPEFYDPKIAGWWVWGLCMWIGSGWCARPEWMGRGNGSRAPRGVLTAAAQGLYEWFEALAERLRRVRVCCGEWDRILGPSPTTKIGMTGVLLDPPYGVEGRVDVYNHESRDLSTEVRQWAIEHGDDPLMRIALCGYEGEHEMPSNWSVVAWKAHGGYAGQRKNGENNNNAARERIWFSPHCLPAHQRGLFEEAAD